MWILQTSVFVNLERMCKTIVRGDWECSGVVEELCVGWAGLWQREDHKEQKDSFSQSLQEPGHEVRRVRRRLTEELEYQEPIQ